MHPSAAQSVLIMTKILGMSTKSAILSDGPPRARAKSFIFVGCIRYIPMIVGFTQSIYHKANWLLCRTEHRILSR